MSATKRMYEWHDQSDAPDEVRSYLQDLADYLDRSTDLTAFIEFAESVEPKDWPSPRGYGYGDSPQARRMKTWHLFVLRALAERYTTAPDRIDYPDPERR